MIQIIKIEFSPLKDKRYRVYLNTNEHFDFGLKDGKTFIDHKNIDKRLNYFKRHLANKKERYLIENLLPSPALFAAILLWGPYINIDGNIKYLNDLWKNSK